MCDPRAIKWRETGIKYGYPECCITFFCDKFDELVEIHTKRQQEMNADLYIVSILSRCVPCDKCYSIILRNAEEISRRFTIQRRI